MRTLKLTLEYDGTNYVGWQRQAEGVSIQGLLEEALVPFEGRAVTVHGAGRTDAGVHARAQVASVTVGNEHDAATLGRAFNAVLPLDVRVLAVEEAALDFHARYHAISKSYEYRIVNAPVVSAFLHRYAWHVPGTLNVPAMRAAGACLAGRHDFAAFQAAGSDVTSTERTILAIDVGPDLDFPVGSALGGGRALHDSVATSLVITVEGDGFLRHMVRAIAGTLVDVGLGRWPASYVAEILKGRDRTRAGRAAPASGLFLKEVKY